MAKTKIGKVMILLKGDYDSNAQYIVLDAVKYQGSLYIAKKDNIGIAPTNSEYWQLSAEKGDKPINGVDYNTEAEKEEFKELIIVDGKSAIDTYTGSKKGELDTKELELESSLETKKDELVNILEDVAVEKTNAYNTNATNKTNEFNNNASAIVTTKTAEFNDNASAIVTIKAAELNESANAVITTKTAEFDESASVIVTNKTSEFDENASAIAANKTAEFEGSASTITTTKTTEFNTNATDKTNEFNSNATEKTNEFNDNVNNMAVPVAGTTGQVLTKKSNTDRDVEWKDVSSKYFVITEDIVTVTTDSTKGVAPYSTSYGYTNIEIDKDSGIEWIEGGLYNFVVDTKLVVNSSYRNVRVRIGEENDGDVWHPVMTSNSIASGTTFFAKAINTTFQYKTVYREEGALHAQTDNNTQYSYLINTVIGDSVGSPVTIDDNGYGAKYSLIFPTTPLSDCIDGNERWSSPMLSSSNATTKKAFTGKLYLDRTPLYIYSANVAKSAKPINVLYQAYTGQELVRYLANTTSNYVTPRQRIYMYLKDFDSIDMSFYADATIGNTMTEDKIKTRFPSSTTGDVYLLYLGWSTASWTAWQPDFVEMYKIYKYTPSTGEFVRL